MRTNYFVGIEGTHGELRKVLESSPGTGIFGMFYGREARERIDLPMEEISQYLFGAFPACEENNIGITRIGSVGPVLTTLVEKSPIGTRVFFFKHVDTTITIDLYTAFLKISATKPRIERLTGMSETALESNPEAYSEAAMEALSELDEVAEAWEASPWAPFDANVFLGGAVDPSSSKLLYRVAYKL